MDSSSRVLSANLRPDAAVHGESSFGALSVMFPLTSAF
ncbi:hypothetical protein RAJCM14343_4430 [Rhodococcus aetherivorans]|uniref:Uncharacterized protein n=1 Tax=Rhodococcus aetherivorans TaxID=191292 RepID=A0ABQ0YRI8_9NOCA|nr:hypothetical protein RAJCM14343_4430 [Rhodococcus aetherivorans]CCW10731.1 hypothetical protein EBESD8_12620 [Rhodococcus aetherivorans]